MDISFPKKQQIDILFDKDVKYSDDIKNIIISDIKKKDKLKQNNERIKKFLGVDIDHDTFIKNKPKLRQYLLLKNK